MFVLTVLVNVSEGKGDEFTKYFRKLATLVRKDPGVITYVCNRSVNNPDRFFFYEKFENETAFKYHGTTIHAKEFSSRIKNILAGTPEVNYYEEIS